jgi:hypothetical protein
VSAAPRDLDGLEALLAEHRAALLEETARFDDEALARRPTPDRWSAAEILEHVAMIERLVTRVVTALANGTSLPPPATTPRRRLAPRWTIDRSFRVEAPAIVRPRGGKSRADLLAGLEASRAALLAVMTGLRGREIPAARYMHPFLGDYDALDWIAYAAYHDDRHRQQMAENRGAADG